MNKNFLSYHECLGLDAPDRKYYAVATRTTVWSDNQVLSASALNGEFNNLLSALALVNADISASAAIAASKLDTTVVETDTVQTITGAKTMTKPIFNASVQGTSALSPSAAATQDLDGSTDNVFLITMPAGNITFTVSNMVAGQFFFVRILQDGTGSRTVSWFSTITWASATAPTLTATGSRADLFAFFAKTASTFDGFIVGQNIG